MDNPEGCRVKTKINEHIPVALIGLLVLSSLGARKNGSDDC